MKKIFLLALVSALCLGIQAAPKKKKDKKNKKAQVEKVDTVDVKTFSYLIGRLNTQGLVEYLTRQKGGDAKYMPQFIEGFCKTELTEAANPHCSTTTSSSAVSWRDLWAQSQRLATTLP